jgi:hypothetical protein
MKTILAAAAILAATAAIFAALASFMPTNDRPEFGRDADGIHRFHATR